MKTRSKKAAARSIALYCILAAAGAHEIPVHKRISSHAAANSAGLNKFISEVFPGGVVPLTSDDLQDPGPRTPLGWIVEGSEREDDSKAPGDQGGYRCCNHFYDAV